MPYVELPMGGGLNLKARATDIGPDQLSQAVGCRYDIAGAVSSLRGRRPRQGLGGYIRGMADATIDGKKYIASKSGTAIYMDNQRVSPTDSFDSEEHASFVTYANRAYVGDGSTTKRFYRSDSGNWNSSSIGVAAPTEHLLAGEYLPEAPTDFVPGEYKYVYTFFNGIAESNFSPPFNVTMSEENFGWYFILENIATGPAGTQSRRIYRTKVNGTAYFFVTEIEDNETTYATDEFLYPDEADDDVELEDVIAINPRPVEELARDSPEYAILQIQTEKWGLSRQDEVIRTNLGILADWVDHDPAPTDLSHLIEIRAQLFGISDNTVYFSKAQQPEHWPVYNGFRPGRREGETIKAILPLNDALIVYTDAKVHRVETVGLTFEDSRTVETDATVGLAGEWAVAEVTMSGGQSAHIFLASNGLYVFDGQSAIEVSQDIEELFYNPNHPDAFALDRMNTAVMMGHRDRVWLSYAAAGSQENNRTLFADFQDQGDVKVSILPYGFSTLSRDRVTNLPIGGDTEGVTYDLDASGGGLWAPTSREYDFGESTRLKAFDELILDADLGGLDTTITVSTDLGRTTSFTLSGTGRQVYRTHLPRTMKGHYVRVGLESTGDAERHWYKTGMMVTPKDTP